MCLEKLLPRLKEKMNQAYRGSILTGKYNNVISDLEVWCTLCEKGVCLGNSVTFMTD